MTTAQRHAAWLKAYHAAIGRLTDRTPTERQKQAARIEADNALFEVDLAEWRAKQERKGKTGLAAMALFAGLLLLVGCGTVHEGGMEDWPTPLYDQMERMNPIYE